jgi:hypothetical protein
MLAMAFQIFKYMAGKREIRKNKNPHFFKHLAPVSMAATKTGKRFATELQI